MISSKVCSCGAQIEADRLSLSLSNCAACAAKNPGNILNDVRDMTLVEGKEMGFSDALYNGKCPICGEKVEWEALFDADGTTYHAQCCKQYLRLTPATVRVRVAHE